MTKTLKNKILKYVPYLRSYFPFKYFEHFLFSLFFFFQAFKGAKFFGVYFCHFRVCVSSAVTVVYQTFFLSNLPPLHAGRMWGTRNSVFWFVVCLRVKPHTRFCCWCWLQLCRLELTKVELHLKPRCAFLFFFFLFVLRMHSLEVNADFLFVWPQTFQLSVYSYQ